MASRVGGRLESSFACLCVYEMVPAVCRERGALGGKDVRASVLPVDEGISNSLGNGAGLRGWLWAAGTRFDDLSGEPRKSFKVILQGLSGVEMGLVVKNSDRTLITGADDCSKHGKVMLSLADGENLGFCGCVHAIEVDAVEVR